MKKLLLCFMLLCFICGCENSSNTNDKEVLDITTDSVFSIMDRQDVYIIDVREEYEYRVGHIENAYNIPISKISGIKKSFIPIDSIVVVYCQSGNRSRQAAKLLLDLGYKNVYDMGGVNSWEYELIRE